ncbi:MAG: cell wall hydrolase [Ruminococcaceae bacterium]|nr:cell wall hydrolase [Oscillospiraceae bacterium]
MKHKNLWLSLAPVYILILGCYLFAGIGGSKAISVIAENAPLTERKRVMIDPGHGGMDGGATSCTGILESKINLEIALRVNDMMHLLGIDTVMTRTEDTSLHTQGNTIAAQKVSDLKERVRMTNEGKNTLLISIHQNHYTDSRYSGAQVFYAPNAESMDFAGQMQDAFVKTINLGSNRKSKRGEGIYLLQKTKIPAILVECGFLSNHTEESKLRSEVYQKKVAAVIAGVCSTYLHSTQ